jgi:hypothetical protein
MSALNQLSDTNGLSTFAINLSQSIYQCSLPGAGGEVTLTVPAAKRLCLISATGNYAVAADATAAMPTGGSFSTSNSMLNAASIWLGPSGTGGNFPTVSVLHFVSNDPVLISVAFYD